MVPTITTLPLQHLASGDRLSLQVYQFSGTRPGKKAYLQANLHGSEIVGNAVLHQLIEFFSTLEATQLMGEIWLVPVCNPFSTNQRTHFFATGRYNPYDGKDWNRIFWDYEKECEDLAAFAKSQIELDLTEIKTNYRQRILANFQNQFNKMQAPSGTPLSDRYRYCLQSLCLDANYVIDIHSSSNQSINYLYCFHGRQESAQAFLLDWGILLNEYDGDAFDEAFLKPWLALEKQLANLGRTVRFDLESWTLELGSGMQMNPASVEKGVRGIKNYLAYKGLLTIADFPLAEVTGPPMLLTPKSQMKKYYAPQGGMIQNRVSPGTTVKAGEQLYQLLSFNKEKQLPTLIEVRAEASGLVFDVSTNYGVNQSEYVLSVVRLPG